MSSFAGSARTMVAMAAAAESAAAAASLAAATGGAGAAAGAATELELKASLLKLYQAYDVVTDEYDKLYDIIDTLREDYDNSKRLFIYKRYKEFKRIVKNSVRKWRTVEKRMSMQMSKKMSSAGLESIISGGSGGSLGGGCGGGGVSVSAAGSMESMYYGRLDSVCGGGSGGSNGGVEKLLPLTNNLNMRIRSYSNATTRDLYAEVQRLEKEVLHYRTQNSCMKSTLLKLAAEYEISKTRVVHVYGRYKQLRVMIKDVVSSDV